MSWGGLHLQWQREGNPKASANQTDRRKPGAEEAERSRSRLDHQTHLKTQVERKFLSGSKVRNTGSDMINDLLLELI